MGYGFQGQGQFLALGFGLVGFAAKGLIKYFLKGLG